MAKDLKVGIIGVSVERGWAKESHVPAVKQFSGLELRAVGTNSQETADAAAKAFGATSAYGEAARMFGDPEINLVSICVRAPAHRALVLGALQAGKHVYCEWPLGVNTAEAEEIAAVARAAGVHAAVGLQMRGNPAVQRARELIATGAIGRVLSARVYSSTVGFGPSTDLAEAYSEKPESGVNLVTIQGAHTIDLALVLLGGLNDLSALTTTQYPEVRIGDNTLPEKRTTFDHLLLDARLACDGALSIEVAGGRPAETPFRLEVVGETGVLALDGGAARGVQSGLLRPSLNGKAQTVDEGELAGLPEAAVNVAGIYAALRDDIHRATTTAPDFDHALALARLVDDVFASSREGRRVTTSGWPVG